MLKNYQDTRYVDQQRKLKTALIDFVPYKLNLQWPMTCKELADAFNKLNQRECVNVHHTTVRAAIRVINLDRYVLLTIPGTGMWKHKNKPDYMPGREPPKLNATEPPEPTSQLTFDPFAD